MHELISKILASRVYDSHDFIALRAFLRQPEEAATLSVEELTALTKIYTKPDLSFELLNLVATSLANVLLLNKDLLFQLSTNKELFLNIRNATLRILDEQFPKEDALEILVQSIASVGDSFKPKNPESMLIPFLRLMFFVMYKKVPDTWLEELRGEMLEQYQRVMNNFLAYCFVNRVSTTLNIEVFKAVYAYSYNYDAFSRDFFSDPRCKEPERQIKRYNLRWVYFTKQMIKKNDEFATEPDNCDPRILMHLGNTFLLQSLDFFVQSEQLLKESCGVVTNVELVRLFRSTVKNYIGFIDAADHDEDILNAVATLTHLAEVLEHFDPFRSDPLWMALHAALTCDATVAPPEFGEVPCLHQKLSELHKNPLLLKVNHAVDDLYSKVEHIAKSHEKQPQPQDDDWDDEQKEAEAERVMGLIEKMNKLGVISMK